MDVQVDSFKLKVVVQVNDPKFEKVTLTYDPEEKEGTIVHAAYKWTPNSFGLVQFRIDHGDLPESELDHILREMVRHGPFADEFMNDVQQRMAEAMRALASTEVVVRTKA